VPAASRANKLFALAALIFQPCQFRRSRQSFRHVLDTILKGLRHMQKKRERSNRRAYVPQSSAVISWWSAVLLNYRLHAVRRPVPAQCALVNYVNEMIELVRVRYIHSNDLHAILRCFLWIKRCVAVPPHFRRLGDALSQNSDRCPLLQNSDTSRNLLDRVFLQSLRPVWAVHR
jgi:hypothetical protein